HPRARGPCAVDPPYHQPPTVTRSAPEGVWAALRRHPFAPHSFHPESRTLYQAAFSSNSPLNRAFANTGGAGAVCALSVAHDEISTVTDTHQPSLLDVRSAPRPQPDVAGVAQVLVDVSLPHLDHTFDYAIPTKLTDDVRPGVRVKVRFAGVERDGFVISRTTSSTHEGALAPLRRVVSDVPVLTAPVLDLARRVAARYAGTTMDVLRLAVPPRHAQTEKSVFSKPSVAAPQWREEPDALPDPAAGDVPAIASASWQPYPGGPAFLRRLQAGDSPRAVWSALPTGPTGGLGSPRTADTTPDLETSGAHWAHAITAAATATMRSGRTVIVCLPDQRDVDA